MLNLWRQIIAAGEKKAPELGIPYNLAVVDAGGNLIARDQLDLLTERDASKIRASLTHYHVSLL